MKNKAILETLTSIKRAGADLIATYFAKDAVRLIKLNSCNKMSGLLFTFEVQNQTEKVL